MIIPQFFWIGFFIIAAILNAYEVGKGNYTKEVKAWVNAWVVIVDLVFLVWLLLP